VKPTNTSSVKCLISKARENARGSQDKIKELWEHINSMYHFINDPELPKKLATSEAMTVFKINKDFLQHGIYQVTMPRGLGWSQELENILKGVYKPFL
jgi:uncharacterized alpha-E superfamily protein